MKKGVKSERLVGGRRKDRVVHVRFSALERAALDAAAEAAGLTISAFIRSLSLEGAGVEPFLTDEDRKVFLFLSSEMRSLYIDLNQISLKAAASGQVEAKKIHSVMIDVQRLVAALIIELQAFGGRSARRRRVQ
jgi:hypothetical protein